MISFACYIADSRDVNEMEALGKKMISHCNGLPLGILVLGGILVTKPTLKEWERVYETVMSHLKMDKGMGPQHQDEVLDMLKFSYDDLPDKLRPCFLYLGQFGENSEIEAEKLYHLWVAESFILSKDRIGKETRLNVAERYLIELSHRSMVQIELEEDESSIREIKSCRLHDLMRDLSMSKAQEENFFKPLDFRHDQLVESSSSSSTNYTRRVVIFPGNEANKIKDVLLDKEVGEHLHSLVLFQSRMERLPSFLSSKLNNFKILKVLAIEGLELCPETNKEKSHSSHDQKKLVEAIGNQIYLRYLSWRGSNFSVFPSSLVRLKHIQTLDLRVSASISIPSRAQYMLQNLDRLLHLYLPNFVSAGSGKTITKLRIDSLINLQTLVNFDPHWCEVDDLFKLLNLRKLTIRVGKSVEDVGKIINYLSSTSSSSLQYSTLSIDDCKLDSEEGKSLVKQLFLSGSRSLHHLEIIGCLSALPVTDPTGNIVLSTGNVLSRIALTTLRFSMSNLVVDPMPILEKIDTLRNLTLSSGAFMGKEMICSASGFPQLRKLELVGLDNLETLEVEEGSMPNLSDLLIAKCEKLEMLPDGVRFLFTLKELTIDSMPEQFINRVRGINGEGGVDFSKLRHVAFINFSAIHSL